MPSLSHTLGWESLTTQPGTQRRTQENTEAVGVVVKNLTSTNRKMLDGN